MPTVDEMWSAPPSSNPDDYPALKGHAPGSVAAAWGDPLPGWSDQSIPQTARLRSWMGQKARTEAKLDDFRDEAKQLFGITDTKQLERLHQIEAGKQMLHREGDEKGFVAFGKRMISNLARDLPFSPFGIVESREYKKAQKALDEGTATDQDIGIIINEEVRQDRRENESEAMKAARAGSSLARTGVEFALGSPAAGAAAKAAGLGKWGTFGLETAARAATVPSLGAYEKTFEQAFKAGRTEPNAQDIVQGFTVGLVNSLVAGQIERVGAGGLKSLGIGSPAAAVPVGAVAGTLEEDVSAAVLKNINLETRYGPLVELMQGRRGDNVSRLVYSLMGEGIFAGAGALRGAGAFDAARAQSVIDAGVKAIDAEARAGKGADETAQSLWGITEEYQRALGNQGTTDLFLKAARSRMGEDASPAAKQLAEELAQTLPEKPPDPFEGLNEQQVKDLAEFVGVGRQGSTKAIQERILADERGKAFLVGEGRLPRPERPAQPAPETPPESPQTADVTPEERTGAQVEESAPVAVQGPRLGERAARLTAKARERSATAQARPGRTEAGTELRRLAEELSPQQKLARAEVLLEKAGGQAQSLRALRYRSETAREQPPGDRGVRSLPAGKETPEQLRARVSALRARAAADRGYVRPPEEAPPKKRLGKKKAEPAAGASLTKAVIDAGGVDPTSAEFLKHFESVGIARANEPALRRPGLFKKGGLGLDQLAQELHAQGHLPNADPQTLMDMLLAKKESAQVADDPGRAARAYEERSARMEEESAPPTREVARDLFGRAIPKRFGSNKGTQLSIEDQLREGWMQRGREWADAQGVKIDEWRAGGQFKAAGEWYQVGAADQGSPVSPVAEARGEADDAGLTVGPPDPELGWMTADAKLGAALTANPKLTPQDRAEIHAAVTHVNGMVPDAVRARLDEAAGRGLIGYEFFADHQSLTRTTQQALLADPLLQRDLQSPDPAVRAKAEADRAGYLQELELIREGKFTGLGSHLEGVVRIDGPGTSSDVTGRYGPVGGVLDRIAIAAHEIGHQLGKLFRLDTRKDWGKVWEKDIKPKNALTRYASQDASEGFAEFSRLLYGSDVSTAAIRRDFPAASKFFTDAGLFPAERAGRDGPLDNRFVLKVGKGEYHLDAGRGNLLQRVRDKVGWLEAERTPGTPQETAEANRVVDEERAARGASPLLTDTRKTNPEVWDAAMARIEADPDLPDRLTNELTAQSRATTIEENAVLLHRKVTLQNAYRRAAMNLNAARESGAPPGDIDRFAAAERNYFEAMDRLDKVLRRTGTEWGRAGQFRRQLAREDYSLGSMLLRAQAAAGRPLTEKEKQEITAQQQAIEKADNAVAAAETVIPGALGTPGRVAKPAAPAGKPGDLTDLRIAAEKARRAFTVALEGHRQGSRPPLSRGLAAVGRVLDIFRPLKTAFDLSMVGRQGAFFLSTRPGQAYSGTKKAIDYYRDSREYDRDMLAIRERANYPLYEQAGIDFTDVAGPISKQEEVRAGDLWRKLAGKNWTLLSPLARGVVASERAYTGFLNNLRVDMADAMIATFAADGRPTAAQLRDIGALVNAGTGRATVGQNARQAMANASHVFFSPNYFVSRLQLIGNLRRVVTGGESGTNATRKLYAKEYARALASLAVLYGIAELLLDDEDGVTFDPRSSDFGKIKLGDTRVDPLGGLAQITTFAGRSVSGQTKDEAGVVTDLRGKNVPVGGRTTSDVFFDFVRGKLAPVPGEMMSVYVGETFDHKPTTVRRVAVGLFVPMSVESVIEGWSDLGFARGTAAGALNVLGVGVRTHGDRDPGQRAITDVHAMRRRWEYDLGRPPEARQGKPAYAGMLEAAVADDFEAFKRARTDFLNKQILSGRTRAQAVESFRESSEGIDPLEGRLNARDKAKFLASRTAEERGRIDEARTIARQRRLKVRQWWARAAAEERR